MDLLQLKYFKDAAFYENFSKAAEVNFVPQSSISKAVKILETKYNTPLFDRIGKNIYLNEKRSYISATPEKRKNSTYRERHASHKDK